MMNPFTKKRGKNNSPVLIISALFLLISVTVLIINYSVNRSITWSLFPIGALILIGATILPLFMMKKNKTLGLYVGFTITLIPFLFLIQAQATVKDWAMPLALPIAGLSILALGVCLIGFAHIKSNRFYPLALTVFLFGVIVNFGVGVIVSRFLNEENVFDISKVSTLSGSAMISLILIVVGYIKENKAGSQREVLH